MICEICHNDIASNAFSIHLKFKHNMCPEEYYNKFIGAPILCPSCGKKTTFKSITKGYRDHCSLKCMRADPVVTAKRENTCLSRYGAKHNWQRGVSRTKQYETCEKRYGNKYPQKTEIIKEKIAISNIKKYGKKSYTQTDEFKTKSKITCEKKYGKQYITQVDDFKDSVKKIKFEKYGDEFFSNRTKAKNTLRNNYGVENPAQSAIIQSRIRKKVEHDGIWFDSSYEVKVYDFCKEHNIDCKYQPISFDYVDMIGKKHKYFPDFMINGEYYEIKGDYLWKDGKLFYPYNNTLTEDELAKKICRDEAKTNCMFDNNVKVILISNIDEWLSTLLQK